MINERVQLSQDKRVVAAASQMTLPLQKYADVIVVRRGIYFFYLFKESRFAHNRGNTSFQFLLHKLGRMDNMQCLGWCTVILIHHQSHNIPMK